MAVDITQFRLNNIIDTCSIWNLLSSKVLYRATGLAGCSFCCTKFVIYECLNKPRKSSSPEEDELIERLKIEKNKGMFKEYHLSIEDLQDVDILEKRKNLSKGELSSIAFARRISQAFLTDDQGARMLASQFMDQDMVQTIPQLFGWLMYESYLNDSDKDEVINEHESFKRPLKKYFNEIYLKALEMRLLKRE